MSAGEPLVAFKDLVIGSVYRARVATGGGWDAVVSRSTTPSSTSSSPHTSRPSTPILHPEPISLNSQNSKHSVLVVSKDSFSGKVTILLFSSFQNKKFHDIVLPAAIPDRETLGRLLLPAAPTTTNPYRPNQLLPLIPPYTSPPTPPESENHYLILIPAVVIPSRVKMRRHAPPRRRVPLSGLEMVEKILRDLRGDDDEEEGEKGPSEGCEKEVGGEKEDANGATTQQGEAGNQEERKEGGGKEKDEEDALLIMAELAKEELVLDFYCDGNEEMEEEGNTWNFLSAVTAQ
ncbi:hypothetical protein HK097_009311 [Rhizophlyctis rosea]|uniref:Uncharacterized protein n=1 Tax=Rhizophlyctis rosea TaxID=64517 RepID=A0AAD5X169_9FUNG|nr:hypothetical protein HK097_009311 [Rhizophlyctis rosea]